MPYGLDVQSLISLSAALLCAGLGALAVIGARGSFVYRVFAFGMLLLALEQFFSFFQIRSDSLAKFQRSDFLKMPAEGLDYCTWLVFSICFAREDRRKAIVRWKWPVPAAGFLLPTIISLS